MIKYPVQYAVLMKYNGLDDLSRNRKQKYGYRNNGDYKEFR